MLECSEYIIVLFVIKNVGYCDVIHVSLQLPYSVDMMSVVKPALTYQVPHRV